MAMGYVRNLKHWSGWGSRTGRRAVVMADEAGGFCVDLEVVEQPWKNQRMSLTRSPVFATQEEAEKFALDWLRPPEDPPYTMPPNAIAYARPVMAG